MLAHSELEEHPTSEQEINGLPCKPGGHLHNALCASALQYALLPQLMSRQGSRHSLFLQCLVNGQPLSP